MLKLEGKIIQGKRIASGSAVDPVTGLTNTLAKQMPFFAAAGLPKTQKLYLGTINMDISPREFAILTPDYFVRDIQWDPNACESFQFVKGKIKYKGKKYTGYIYYPCASPLKSHPDTRVELLTRKLPGLHYGDMIRLEVPEGKIVLKPCQVKEAVLLPELCDDLHESIKLQKKLREDVVFHQAVGNTIEAIVACLRKGKKLITAGNGGSAADAQHFAAEFVGHYKLDRPGLPALALTPDSSVVTAIGNDYSYEDVFARQIEALGQKGDVFAGFTTSGNSENINRALQKARKKGLVTICFVGKDGGKAKELADIVIHIPSDNCPRIQEVHTLVLHRISETVEKNLQK